MKNGYFCNNRRMHLDNTLRFFQFREEKLPPLTELHHIDVRVKRGFPDVSHAFGLNYEIPLEITLGVSQLIQPS